MWSRLGRPSQVPPPPRTAPLAALTAPRVSPHPPPRQLRLLLPGNKITSRSSFQMMDPREPLGVGLRERVPLPSLLFPCLAALQLRPLEEADVGPFGLGWSEARGLGALRGAGAGAAVSPPGPWPSAPASPLERSQSKFHSLWSSAARGCGHSWVRPGSYPLKLERSPVLSPETLRRPLARSAGGRGWGTLCFPSGQRDLGCISLLKELGCENQGPH